MDDALVRLVIVPANETITTVLILVVMDDALVQGRGDEIKTISDGLNPCCNG